MKNKGLLAAVVVIILALGGYAVYSMGQNSGKKAETANSSTTEDKNYTVGVLQLVSHPALDQIYEGIKEGMAEEGLEEGKNLTIKFQNGQGDQNKMNTMSQQLINDGSEALIGIATPACQALANATNGKLPVILGAVTDPVAAELVTSMDKPGANITGVSDQPPVDKIIELAHQILPDAKKVGMLYSSKEANSKSQVEKASAAAEKLGLEVVAKPVATGNEVAQTVQVLAGQVDFIFVPNDNTIANAMETVAQEAEKNQVAVFPSVDTMVEQGGLATIGVNQKAIGVATGKMAAKVIKGEAKTADTPIEIMQDGDTIINEKVAKELGITLAEDLTKDAKLIK